MIDEFRTAFQELIDASVVTDPGRFPPAVQKVYHLASDVPPEERELALEALGPFLGGGHTAPGITADLAVVAGALVEMGTAPGPAGVEVVRLLRSIGQGAAVFLYAWDRTGGDRPPEPDDVTAAAEERVAAELGETAPTATVCWWTIRRYSLAAKTMLTGAEVRSAIRSDPELRAELVAISNQLSTALPEFADIRALLRMAEATSALVLERSSGRAFRVLFDGIGDNFQLHTLLADALIGEQGRGLAGQRPDPRWTASFRDSAPDPAAGVVQGWWNLVALDGSWVWNEGVPADIPKVDGEHVLVLEQQPYVRSWSAGRRHPLVRGWLEVEEELTAEEAAQWWRRAASPAAGASRAAPTAEAAGPAAGPAGGTGGPDGAGRSGGADSVGIADSADTGTADSGGMGGADSARAAGSPDSAHANQAEASEPDPVAAPEQAAGLLQDHPEQSGSADEPDNAAAAGDPGARGAAGPATGAAAPRTGFGTRVAALPRRNRHRPGLHGSGGDHARTGEHTAGEWTAGTAWEPAEPARATAPADGDAGGGAGAAPVESATAEPADEHAGERSTADPAEEAEVTENGENTESPEAAGGPAPSTREDSPPPGAPPLPPLPPGVSNSSAWGPTWL
ncbi:hypothetical protein GCM10027570_27160 [Streptomonospora sediminis]